MTKITLTQYKATGFNTKVEADNFAKKHNIKLARKPRSIVPKSETISSKKKRIQKEKTADKKRIATYLKQLKAKRVAIKKEKIKIKPKKIEPVNDLFIEDTTNFMNQIEIEKEEPVIKKKLTKKQIKEIKKKLGGKIVYRHILQETNEETMFPDKLTDDNEAVYHERDLPNFMRSVLKKLYKKNSKFLFLWKRNGIFQDVIVKSGDFFITHKPRFVFEIKSNKKNKFRNWWSDEGFMLFNIDSFRTLFSKDHLEISKLIDKYLYEKYGTSQASNEVRDEALKYVNDNYPSLTNPVDEVILIINDDDDSEEHVEQYFLDGEGTHCLFTPILNWIEDKILTVKSNKNYLIMRNKVQRYIEKYNHGICKDDIKSVCDDLKIDIYIKDIVGNKILTAKCEKHKLRNFHYINNRVHHVELNESSRDVEYITSGEMQDLRIKLDRCREHYVFKCERGSDLYTMILDKNKKYLLKNEDNEAIYKFNADNGLDKFTYDFVKEEDKCDFISQGVRYYSHFSYPSLNKDDLLYNDENDYIEYDLKTAYLQGNKEVLGDLYFGYPTVLTPPIAKKYTLDDVKKNPGYYQCNIIQNNSVGRARKHLRVLDIYVGKQLILTTPEIVFFSDLGIVFDITIGSYSFKTTDIVFTQEMLYNRRYCKWGGMLNMLNTTTCYNFYASEDYVTVLKEASKGTGKTIDAFYIKEEDRYYCTVTSKRNKCSTLHHIGGFITAYCRINVFKKLFEEQIEDVLGYKLDGYVVKKREFMPTTDIWKLKPAKIDFNWGMKPYSLNDSFDKAITYDTQNIIGESDFHKQYIFLSGQGGSGKTHVYLTGRTDGIYSSRIWRLCVEKQNDYGVQSMSINRLLTLKIENASKPYLNENVHPAFIFIDECNMIPKEWIDNVIETYPYSQIILAGDLNEKRNEYYQCGFSDITNIFDDERFTYIQFNKSYRCKDETLHELLVTIRNAMDTNFNTEYITKELHDFIVNNKKILKKKKATTSIKQIVVEPEIIPPIYDYKNDWILCSTKKKDDSRSKYWNKLLNGKKYIITSHNESDIMLRKDGYKAYLNGDIIIDPDESVPKRGEYRDGYTIHSFQGITIKNPNRLFIDMACIFDPRQIYTAISRVENIEQLYFII